ncbi:MAG: 16S rRNA (guanine(527)-N(7))-methyltransferase RsmG [Treponema sp.]|nr:16S rRNA (guanine(527)-N(7))-methyltransferase RsmG [Treponema sp.]
MTLPVESDFAAAVELWREWNGRINVVSRKDEENIFGHHILHSLAIAEYLERTYGIVPETCRDSFLDVGTGGGFPGIPLALTFPGASFTLCDSIGKKIKVAQAVCDGLGLKNAECVNARVESLRGPWDWVVSRAVTSLDNFFPWDRGRFGRSILYLKGGDVNAEIAALVARCHVPRENISCWKIESWLKDEYFAEKFVIEIKR